jgi:methyltransferase (TIGR00027 family)
MFEEMFNLLGNIAKRPSNTAEEVTLIRIVESKKEESKRICYDPLAIRFISPETLKLLQNPEKAKKMKTKKDVLFRGVVNSIAARVRYFDDFVAESLKNGFKQLVILGAGYDTRAYRIKDIEKIKVFEMDHFGTQKVKIEKIKEIFGSTPHHVEYIPVDFETEPLGQKLFDGGYNGSKKTLFLMEGLIYYIPPEAVASILSFIIENSGKGSTVLFDYVSQVTDFDESPDKKVAENLLKFMDECKESLKFTLEKGTVKKFISKQGFADIKEMTAEDYKKVYFHGENNNREVFSLMSFVNALVE